jgi:hypothetical protein
MSGIDILWIGIALSVVMFSAFTCAVLWRVVRLLWSVHGLVDEGKEALLDVRRSLLSLTSRFDGHLQAVTLLGDRLLRFIGERFDTRTAKRSNTKGENEQG